MSRSLPAWLEPLARVFAALACGLSVALGAYASHVAEPQSRQRLALAALFAFGHGLALIQLDARSSRLARLASACFVIGIVLFCGSLAGAGLVGSTTKLVPFGGGLLILGWLFVAADLVRKR